MLRITLAELATRDEEKFVYASQGRKQRAWNVVVGLSYLYAPLCKVLRLFEVACQSDELTRRQFLEQLVDNQTAQMTRRTSYGNHGLSPCHFSDRDNLEHGLSPGKCLRLGKRLPISRSHSDCVSTTPFSSPTMHRWRLPCSISGAASEGRRCMSPRSSPMRSSRPSIAMPRASNGCGQPWPSAGWTSECDSSLLI